MRPTISLIAFLTILGGRFDAATAATTPNTLKDVREYSEVTLVEVPVYVTGRDGKPVRGLTKADFAVEDDENSQVIDSIDEIDLDRSVPSEDAVRPPADRRRFLFLFDLSFASPNSVLKARQAAIEFVGGGLLPEDLAGVATTTVESGPHLLLNFTSDRRQLVAALRAVGLTTLIDRERDPLAFAFVRPGDPNAPIPLGGNGDIKLGYDEVAVLSQIYKTMAQKTADRFTVTRIERQLDDMGSLAKALDLIEGRKTIVLFSEGFDGGLLSGTNGATQLESAYNDEAMFHGMYWMTDVDKRFADSPLALNLERTLDVFRRSDCVVYAVDISGLKSQDGSVAADSRGNGSEALYAIASGTGGELIAHSNDLVHQLGRIESRTRHFYVLAFRPTRHRAGEFHRLKVRVRGRGRRVSARAGYFESRQFTDLSPLERTLSAADLVAHDSPQGDFSIELLTVPFREGPATRAAVVVRVPPDSFGDDPSDSKSGREIGLYIYAMNSSGQLVDYVTRLVRISGSTEMERARRGLVYSGVLRLTSGDYRIRALVRDEMSGRYGLGVKKLTVPDFSVDGITLLPPLFSDRNGGGLKFRDSAKESGELLFVHGEDFLPDPAPRVEHDRHAQLCLLAYGVGSQEHVAAFRIDGWIRGVEGRLAPAPISLVGRTQPDADGLTKLLMELSAEGLAAGDYVLRITIRDVSDPECTSTNEASFRVF